MHSKRNGHHCAVFSMMIKELNIEAEMILLELISVFIFLKNMLAILSIFGRLF